MCNIDTNNYNIIVNFISYYGYNYYGDNYFLKNIFIIKKSLSKIVKDNFINCLLQGDNFNKKFLRKKDNFIYSFP